ncbi:hypothetical protein [Acinetobacter sp. c3-l95]|uniref:hypothetical protein n=1 Tax=Acinetobacter sp. c3-l95 TaxID=3342804 RepID=UPI0035BB83C1
MQSFIEPTLRQYAFSAVRYYLFALVIMIIYGDAMLIGASFVAFLVSFLIYTSGFTPDGINPKWQNKFAKSIVIFSFVFSLAIIYAESMITDSLNATPFPKSIDQLKTLDAKLPFNPTKKKKKVIIQVKIICIIIILKY